MITPHGAVLAGEPMSAALTEDNVARDYILFCEASVICSPDNANLLKISKAEGKSYHHSSSHPVAFQDHPLPCLQLPALYVMHI
jgi:hypothetical protein